MCVFKYHVFIYFLHPPPPWSGTLIIHWRICWKQIKTCFSHLRVFELFSRATVSSRKSPTLIRLSHQGAPPVGLFVDPELPPEIVAADVPLPEVLDDRLARLLPVFQSAFPLSCPRLVLRLDHHHAPLVGTWRQAPHKNSFKKLMFESAQIYFWKKILNASGSRTQPSADKISCLEQFPRFKAKSQ